MMMSLYYYCTPTGISHFCVHSISSVGRNVCAYVELFRMQTVMIKVFGQEKNSQVDDDNIVHAFSFGLG